MRPDFIIVGLERSGGHWVTALLNSHPDIAAFPVDYFVLGKSRIGELHFFNTIASVAEPHREHVRPFEDFAVKFGGRYADLVPLRGKVSDDELISRFAKRYSEICEGERGSKKIVGELSSRYVLFMDWIDKLFPNKKKICIIRDPKDRIVSWYQNKEVQEKGSKEMMVPREFAVNYTKANVVPEYEALLNYDGSLHGVSYEALHKNPVPVVEGLLTYLDMSYSREIVEHMIEGATFEKQTERHEGRARKLGEAAMSPMRKGIVGDYKECMAKETIKEVDAITKDLEISVHRKLMLQ